MTRQSTKQALVIAHEPLGGGALISHFLDRRGYRVHEHVVTTNFDRPNNAAPFPDMADYDIIVPMGSIRSLTNTDEISNWVFAEIDLLQQAGRRGVPMLGVCFGAQLLATAFGGTVELAPAPEIGWYPIHDPDVSSRTASNPMTSGPWFQWHHDRFVPPADAEVLAVNACGVQSFRLGRSVGIQFHPEVTHTHVKGFLSEAAADYLDEHNIDEAQMLEDVRHHEPRNARQCAALVDWFIDEVAVS